MKIVHPVDVGRTCREWFDHAANAVRAEMNHSWNTHGEPTKDLVRGAANLCEEVGEVAKEALDATRPILVLPRTGNPLIDNERDRVFGLKTSNQLDSMIRMHHELMQVAGYAILLAVQLEGTIREAVDGKNP